MEKSPDAREMRRARLFPLLWALVLAAASTSIAPVQSLAQHADLSFLTTRAERTHFEETTRYDELMGFLDVVTSQSPRLHLTEFGYSVEGRALPLVVYGDVADASPDAVRASNKLRVYVQGNIHAGEVCGKEALLMMIRELAMGQHQDWADSLVVLFAPIYNADGNERITLFNRPRQNGPYGGMGQRPNAQDLDLNRDHMKVKSPEARSLIRLMNEYDPQILVDLHTTNGTQHAYHVTYSPPLNPDTDPGIIDLLRGEMLPAITETIRAKHGWEYYYYGNLPFRSSEPGWYTFDHRPRFNNNYVGLRNRLAILSEAYAYASFEERVMASYYFVEEILNYATVQPGHLAEVVEAADAHSVIGEQLAVRSDFGRSDQPVEILLGETRDEPNPYSGELVRVRENVVTPTEMYEYGTFQATETQRVPSFYYVDPAASVVGPYLDTHGIAYETLNGSRAIDVEAFVVDSTTAAARPFQGVNERTAFGHNETKSWQAPVGTLRIPLNQPLGRLAFYLLEPRSDDGLVDWAQMDRYLEPGEDYPVYRSTN